MTRAAGISRASVLPNVHVRVLAWRQMATFTSSPSATRSSHDFSAAPCPAASGSKLRTTFPVNRLNC